MKSISKFLSFLLILGVVGQFAKYQSANHGPTDFVVSDIRTVTEVCKDELVIRLPLDACRLLAHREVSKFISFDNGISISLKILVG